MSYKSGILQAQVLKDEQTKKSEKASIQSAETNSKTLFWTRVFVVLTFLALIFAAIGAVAVSPTLQSYFFQSSLSQPLQI